MIHEEEEGGHGDLASILSDAGEGATLEAVKVDVPEAGN